MMEGDESEWERVSSGALIILINCEDGVGEMSVWSSLTAVTSRCMLTRSLVDALRPIYLMRV